VQIAMRAPGLRRRLDKGHHGGTRCPEQLRRMTARWDAGSPFYGAQLDTERQGRGERVPLAIE